MPKKFDQDDSVLIPVVIQKELFQLVQDKVISATEAWLFTVIESYCNKTLKGCYVKTSVLGKNTGKETRQVQLCLAKLQEVGLIKQTGWKKQGRIKTKIWKTTLS
jgi:hypothetical protein